MQYRATLLHALVVPATDNFTVDHQNGTDRHATGVTPLDRFLDRRPQERVDALMGGLVVSCHPLVSARTAHIIRCAPIPT